MPGAAAGGVFLRCVNTLDACWGYRNERYLAFGRVAAKTDDWIHFLPARLTLIAIALAAPLFGGSLLQTLRIGWKHRKDHPSPNSCYGMAGFAGALQIRLGGPTAYSDGVEFYPVWGEGRSELTWKDLHRAEGLAVSAALIFVLLLTMPFAAAGKYGVDPVFQVSDPAATVGSSGLAAGLRTPGVRTDRNGKRPRRTSEIPVPYFDGRDQAGWKVTGHPAVDGLRRRFRRALWTCLGPQNETAELRTSATRPFIPGTIRPDLLLLLRPDESPPRIRLSNSVGLRGRKVRQGCRAELLHEFWWLPG